MRHVEAPAHPGQRHVVHGLELQHLPAHHPGEARPDPQRQHHHDDFQRLAHGHHQHQRHQDQGQRQYDVHQPHQEFINPAPVPAGHQPQYHPQHAADSQRDQRDNQRYASAENHPAQQVAPQVVRAQQEFGAASGADFHVHGVADGYIGVYFLGLVQGYLQVALAGFGLLHHQLRSGGWSAPEGRQVTVGQVAVLGVVGRDNVGRRPGHHHQQQQQHRYDGPAAPLLADCAYECPDRPWGPDYAAGGFRNCHILLFPCL